MIKSPIWKDIYYNTPDSILDYQLKEGDEVIHTGYSKRMPDKPGVTISINTRVEEYLNNDFHTDIRDIEDEVILNEDAYKEYDMYTNSNVVETYGLLYDWSYEDVWTGQSKYMMTTLINGHTDPRMKSLTTMYNSADTVINWAIEYRAYVRCNTKEIVYPLAGGSYTIDVFSTGNWQVIEKPAWCTMDVTSHTGTYTEDMTTITITAPAYNDYQPGRIVIESEDGIKVVILVSYVETYLEITPISHHFDWSGGTVQIRVDYNVNFTYSSNSDWLTLSAGTIPTPTGEIISTYITASASTNLTGLTRDDAVVTFTYGGGKTKQFTATQDYRLDNKVFYVGSKPFFIVNGRNKTPVQSWGADVVSGGSDPCGYIYVYDNETGEGYIPFTDTVTMYNGMMYNIGSQTAYTFDRLFSVTLPSGVTSINNVGIADGGGVGFAEERMLTSVTLSDSLTYIGEDAFYYIGRDTERIHPDGIDTLAIPSGVTEIAYRAFYNAKIKHIIFNGPASLTNIGQSALQSPYFESFYLPDTVQTIGQAALEATKVMNVPTSVKVIQKNAFKGCTNITSANIPDCYSIQESGFYGCTSLTGITVGTNVETLVLQDMAFANCSNLNIICIYSTWCLLSSGGAQFAGVSQTGVLYYRSGSDVSNVISALPSGWIAIAVGLA